MPAKDTFHDAVKNALEKDGWIVKADPLHLKWGRRDFYVDLSADKFFLADKGEWQIAVEVKSFVVDSAMSALEQALGQFLIYRSILRRLAPKRKLYLAITENVFVMERLKHYRQLIKNILTEHARVPYSYGDLKSVTVFDEESDHYLMIAHGWEDKRRVHDCMIHVDIIDGKFWIQYDGTEYGIARELRDAGVPQDHIVLGFHSPEMRQYTEYAAA